MNELSPPVAARLARDVYQLTNTQKLGIAINRLKKLQGTIIHVDCETPLSAKTGGPLFIKSRSAFGLCTFGKDIYQGHAFIVLRGTKFLADWLTNLNLGTSRSAYGQSIHDGFHQAFRSMLAQLKPFISSFSTQRIHSVHCIGHSLGGALATLCAEQIRASTPLKPYLYSFGAPRVGLRPFADMLSAVLGPERMFRVYHRTDIVTCVPFWPFVHAPTLWSETYDYYQPSPGEFPSGQWHAMDCYVSTVKKHNWSQLRNKRDSRDQALGIESWLNKEGPVSFTVTNLEWLDKAINYILAKCLNGAGNALTSALSGTFTLMDQLAYILKKGIDLSQHISGIVLSLMRKVMSMLGMKPVLDKMDLTQIFIRNVFKKLSQRISNYCRRVLDNVLVNGQGM